MSLFYSYSILFTIAAMKKSKSLSYKQKYFVHVSLYYN